MKKRTVQPVLLLVCFIAVLACNFPLAQRGSATDTTTRETLTARLFPSPTTTSEANPLPSETQVPQGVSPDLQTAAPDLPLSSKTSSTGPVFNYSAQSGDTLAGLAGRFGVDPSEISSPRAIPATGLILAGQTLSIPNRLGTTGPGAALLPDSEICLFTYVSRV